MASHYSQTTGLDALRDLIPVPARKVVYAVYGLAGIVIGILQIVAGNASWMDTVVSVYAYLGIPVGAIALTNTVPVQAAGDSPVTAEAGPESPLPTGTPVEVTPQDAPHLES